MQNLLLDAAQRLESTSESARADAEILLAHCLQKSRTWLTPGLTECANGG